MDWTLVLLAALTLPSGLYITEKMLKCCVWDFLIRKNGTSCMGFIDEIPKTPTGRTASGARPLIRVNGIEGKLESVRVLSWFSGQQDHFGKPIELVFSERYPGRCTHGKWISLLLELILFLPIGVFLILVGLESLGRML